MYKSCEAIIKQEKLSTYLSMQRNLQLIYFRRVPLLSFVLCRVRAMSYKITRKLLTEDAVTNRKHLFEEALKSAKTGKVLYIMCEELNELPQLSQEVASLNKHYMKMISFLYAKDVDSLIESLCSLPDWQNVPSTIILDELNSYCDLDDWSSACYIVSLLMDSAASCAQLLQIPCALYVSLTKKGSVDEENCDVLQELYFA